VSAAALLAGPGAGIIAGGGGGGGGLLPGLTGLGGVWLALVGLMAARAATLAWRYQSASGPVPPVIVEEGGGGGGGAARGDDSTGVGERE
jgi:hypothetical protein